MTEQQNTIDNDEIYQQACQLIKEREYASISHLQRKLKLGYNRAARLIEAMIAQGIVLDFDEKGQRKVVK